MVFPTLFNLSLNLAIRSSWSEPQSAPSLVFADCIELLHLWLGDSRHKRRQEESHRNAEIRKPKSSRRFQKQVTYKGSGIETTSGLLANNQCLWNWRRNFSRTLVEELVRISNGNSRAWNQAASPGGLMWLHGVSHPWSWPGGSIKSQQQRGCWMFSLIERLSELWWRMAFCIRSLDNLTVVTSIGTRAVCIWNQGMLCPLTCVTVVMGWDQAGSEMRADTRLSALAAAATCLPIDLQVWAAAWPYQLVTLALPPPSVNSESASEGSEHPLAKTLYLQINSMLARKQRPYSLRESILRAFPHKENKGKNERPPPYIIFLLQSILVLFWLPWTILRGFPGVSVVKNLTANAGNTRDVGSVPGSGRFPGREHGNLFQYSCLENPMDRGAWWATDHGDKKDSVMSEHSHLPRQIVLTLSYRSFQI